MLIVMSGVSGSGKNTIINKLRQSHKELLFFKSATTRPRREGEENYYYFTEEEFAFRKGNREFFETEEVHGYYYGIMNRELEKIITDTEHDYIKDVDVHGNQRLRKYLKGKAKMLSIFLDAPDEVLHQRLLGRGESEERIKVRLSRAEMERSCKSDYDLVIENIDLDTTVETIEKAYAKAKKSK